MPTTTFPPILIWQPGGGTPIYTPAPPPAGHAPPENGLTSLVIGQNYVDVVFVTPQPRSDWTFNALEVVNVTDTAPLNIWVGVATSKTRTGFRVYLNGLPDTANYYLDWSINGGTVATAGTATAYLLSGPDFGPIGVATAFTVALPLGTTVDLPVTVIPNDGGIGGTFSPVSVALTTDLPSANFTYTPAHYGAVTIGSMNDSLLTDPGSIAFTSVVATYLLSGPSSGIIHVASTNFTVALPAGGVTLGAIAVTPSDALPTLSAGTFTPSSVNLTTAAPSATFTYTPASTGAITISVTNNRSLTNPGNLTYTASPAPHLLNTLISYWKMDEASGTRNDSQGSNHLTAGGSLVGVAGKINNGAQFVSASSQFLNVANNSSLQVTSDFTFSVWFNLTTVAASKFIFSKGSAGTTNDYSLQYLTGTGLVFWVNIPLSGSNAALTPVLSAGVWYHAVVWFDSGTGQVYLRVNDTTTYQSTTSPGLGTPATQDFIFGSAIGAGTFLDGLVDEVGFWKRKLTTPEITALYNSGAGLPFSSFTL